MKWSLTHIAAVDKGEKLVVLSDAAVDKVEKLVVLPDDRFASGYYEVPNFLHIPKCGTSLWHSILMHAGLCQHLRHSEMGPAVLDGCPHNAGVVVKTHNLTGDDQRCCLGARRMHVPLKESSDFKVERWLKTPVVTMLRDPVKRIESQFNYAIKSKWIPNQSKTYKPFNEIAVRIMENQNVSTLEQYSSLWFMQNCQTKFLTGYDCAAPVNITSAEYEQAAKALVRLDFFGITDYWKESICLFHATFGLGPITDAQEMENRRPTAGVAHSTLPESTLILLERNEYYDVKLFSLGRDMFFSRAEKAGCLESKT
uniref:Sulfotransferase domain-containing protein n=1 Tax=Heterosigma akashiwo TaxID=2829 RepID=A0A7S3YEH7_HETAK